MASARAWRAGLGAILLVAGLGCEDSDDFGPVQVRFSEGIERKTLVGLWTGTEEITGAEDLLGSLPGGAQTGSGFAFPVALRLTLAGEFVLWTFSFPAGGETTRDRFCEGVYAIRDRVIEFFPNRVCRALPLSRFRIARGFSNTLVLEAESGPGQLRTPGTDLASIRVRLSLRRD